MVDGLILIANSSRKIRCLLSELAPNELCCIYVVERNKKGNQEKSKYFWPVNIILCVLIIITVLILGDFQWLRWLQWLLLHITEIFKSPS